MQGERDAETADAANAYLENLEAFVQATRDVYGQDFTFVIAELRTVSAPWSFHEIVREAQHEVALEAGDNVVLVETDGLSLDDDAVHYDIPGRHGLGQALVDAIREQHVELVGDQVVTEPQLLKGSEPDNDIVGGAGGDVIVGHGGRDTIFGGDGKDTLVGGEAADNVYGGDGNDTLHGGAGQDLLVGGDGDDRIFGGARSDRLVGGDGADRFFFQGSDGAASNDIIVDFLAGIDKIVVRGQAISNVSDTADGALVQFDSGASVLMQDITSSQLSQFDFVFQAGGSGEIVRI